MAISTTGIMRQQLMRNPLDTTPEAGMEGSVTRVSIVSDLIEANKDIQFSDLVEHYMNISGQADRTLKPMTAELMKKESPVVSGTSIEKKSTDIIKDVKADPIIAEDIDIPTPMSDAMTLNTLSPIGTINEQNNGLMKPEPV